MSTNRVWKRLTNAWPGVMLLTALQFVLVVVMINDITITQLPPENAYGSAYKKISVHPEDASWWLYLIGVVVMVLGCSTLFWRPFKNMQQNVVTIFFVGVVPALFSVVTIVYVIKNN